MPPGKTSRNAGRTRDARLGAAHWVEAARQALIKGGVGAVKVERLAADLGVTTGSFYWHFAGRRALLAALLEDWKRTNTEGMVEAVARAGPSADAQFDAVIHAWVNEDGFSPAYDSAVRDWARTSKPVEAAVVEADRQRIALLKGIFEGLGYDENRAEVRARIMYFHQVGYYALNVREDLPTRLRQRPLYIEALREGPGRE